MMHHRFTLFAAALTLLASPIASAQPSAASEIRFNRDIRPILSDNCFHCHGPDSAARKAKLRLDRDTGLFGKTANGVAVVPGKPDQSEVYTRITSSDEDELMPPPTANHKLTEAQKNAVKHWIEQGAKWQPHWSFIAPERGTPPAVKNTAWVRNPIDRFILAKLEDAGLNPAPEADRRTLARRLSLDLTGLPPDPAEVEAFVKDSSPDAYEKLVDRWLALPQYGEHRAHYWLDAARYADTHGMHFDNYREMWPYREWVINAFNQNVPFDRFSIDQLAGDLFPERKLDDQVATGFIRCGMTTNEGGTIPEENLVMYARDRTETFSRVYLGLTMNCCVCHDHKFDPLPTKDFYSLSAMFANNTMGALDGNIKDTPPVVVVPRKEDREAFAKASADEISLKQKLAARPALAKGDFAKWSQGATPALITASLPTRQLHLQASLSEGKGDKIQVTQDGTAREISLSASAQWQKGVVAEKALLVDKGAACEIADAGDFEKDQPYSIAAWIKLPGQVTGAVVSRMDDQHGYRGWDLWIEGNRVGGHIIQNWDGNDALKVVSADKPLEPNKWHYVCLTYDGSAKAAGVKIYVDGRLQKNAAPQKDSLKGSIRTTVPMKVGQRHSSSLISNLMVQDLRLYKRVLNKTDVKDLALATQLTGLLNKPADKRTEPERKELFDWWLANVDAASIDINEQLASVQEQVEAIKARGGQSLVMQEKPTPPVAFVLYRGDYDKRRDQVGPGTPGILPPMAKDAPQNRLGLAQWLFSPAHPLTARVTVNRYWQEIFGAGIVRSADDFGISGESPTHPELLDWLAVDFRENQWDMKRMIRLLVTSATYRQTATLTPEKLEKDPQNKLLSRGPRFRMDAEMVRDSALAESGLLTRRMGGPSVRPYQPPGVWDVVGLPGGNTRDYVQDHGENLYRRSLYTMWKRMAPPVSMDVFNAPSRESCTVRRDRTNTPLQALVTLNDVQFMEAARVLAQRAIQQGGGFNDQLNFISTRILARPMTPEEAAICKSAYDDFLKDYQSHGDEARKLLAFGESPRDEKIDPATHAAMTMLVNQVMNLDEALNK